MNPVSNLKEHLATAVATQTADTFDMVAFELPLRKG